MIMAAAVDVCVCVVEVVLEGSSLGLERVLELGVDVSLMLELCLAERLTLSLALKHGLVGKACLHGLYPLLGRVEADAE